MNERIKSIQGICFAYDGCHKIYVCEDEQDINDAKEAGYKIYPMRDLKSAYINSCSLKFISNWKLDKQFIAQFEFEGGEN